MCDSHRVWKTTIQGFGATERTYRRVLLGKPYDSLSLLRLQAASELSWAIFLWKKNATQFTRPPGSKEITNRDLRSGWIFFSFKAADVGIKGNLESLKRKSRNTRCLLTSIASSIFSLPWLLLNSNVIVFKVTFIILHAQSCLTLLQPQFLHLPNR